MVLAFNPRFKEPIQKGIKIHTIREDANNRWKAGNTIHMATGVRTKNYQCFNQTPCISTQTIEIKWKHGKMVDNDPYEFDVYVDGKKLENPVKWLLINNDGFTQAMDFAEWFCKDFKGKIIHWTDFKY